jgi:hypothetical protein
MVNTALVATVVAVMLVRTATPVQQTRVEAVVVPHTTMVRVVVPVVPV